MVKSGLAALALVMALVMAVPATAAQIAVTRYDMVNGGGQSTGGSSNYWDLGYTGSGCTNCDYAALSGGVGQLTDGIAASDYWYPVENEAGTGPYVGWWDVHAPSPVVTFFLAHMAIIDSIAIHLDNSNFGGVNAPTDIRIDGQSYNFVAPMLGTAGWVTFAGLSLSGNQHSVQFVQAPGSYTFVSEVSFTGSVVPEPGQWALLAGGFALIGGALRRSRRAAVHAGA